MDIVPVSDVLIVKELNVEEKLASGLIVPPEAQNNDTLSKGEILAAGPGRVSVTGVLSPNEFKKGDIIVYEKRRSILHRYGGFSIVFINAGEVFGTVEVIN